ncbi:hypothetical protein, partial [Pedobacter sp. Hv1]|uniref:hypothetical protein n=1 Tax=Pedobacter sp. Hv1 TaxID=1740090 RepID=UPI0006D8C95C
GQAYANANGTCSYPPKITGPVKASLGVEYDYFADNTSGGDTFQWIIPSNFASIESGQGTGHISILINYDISNPPKVFTISLKITSSTGIVKLINYNITAIRGRG